MKEVKGYHHVKHDPSRPNGHRYVVVSSTGHVISTHATAEKATKSWRAMMAKYREEGKARAPKKKQKSE